MVLAILKMRGAFTPLTVAVALLLLTVSHASAAWDGRALCEAAITKSGEGSLNDGAPAGSFPDDWPVTAHLSRAPLGADLVARCRALDGRRAATAKDVACVPAEGVEALGVPKATVQQLLGRGIGRRGTLGGGKVVVETGLCSVEPGDNDGKSLRLHPLAPPSPDAPTWSYLRFRASPGVPRRKQTNDGGGGLMGGRAEWRSSKLGGEL